MNLAAVTAWLPAALRYVHEFEALDERTRAVLVEWLVAQELSRRAAWEGADPEALGFWHSREHEIDFVVSGEHWIEVKLGRAGPLDFRWFAKSLARERLTVVCSTPFETERIRGVTLRDFLLEGPSRVAAEEPGADTS